MRLCRVCKVFISTFNSAVVRGWLADQPALASRIPRNTDRQAKATALAYMREHELSIVTEEVQYRTMVSS
jgi:hypothetical protein